MFVLVDPAIASTEISGHCVIARVNFLYLLDLVSHPQLMIGNTICKVEELLTRQISLFGLS